MSQTLGRIVLQRVADQYELNPRSWCRGAGSLRNAGRWQSAQTVAERLCDPEEDGCIYSMIRAQSIVVARKEWRRAARQAVGILSRHHDLRFGRVSVMICNDKCENVEEAVAFIDEALGYPAKPMLMPPRMLEKEKLPEFA